MISTRQLRYFVEIAESGSFSAAAERLFVAQSALSRQIKELETLLQTPLFERTARLPRLTAQLIRQKDRLIAERPCRSRSWFSRIPGRTSTEKLRGQISA